MKTCRVCGMSKPLEEFEKNKRRADGYDNRCLECGRAYKKQKLIDKYGSVYEAGRAMRSADPEKIRRWKHDDYLCRKDAVLEKNHEYYRKNRDAVLEYCKRYREEHQDWKRAYDKKYAEEHPETARKAKKSYRMRHKDDLTFKIRGQLSTRLYHVLRRCCTKKSKGTLDFLGCTLPELMDYLEKQFQDGMSWDNYGEWHIDHIRPCASFDLSDPVQQQECFHFSNLQPLWAEDNMKKGSLWEGVRMYPRRT